MYKKTKSIVTWFREESNDSQLGFKNIEILAAGVVDVII
jgi:hypothetical protein